MTITLEDRCVGSLVGLACGDAIGTTVEFSPRGTFTPVSAMTGGGPFGLSPGQWTDDTSMALCLAESLLEKNGFDARDQMTRYLNWWHWGYLSSTGACFDIGATTQAALARYEKTGEPYAGDTSPRTAGNGSLMRLAPVVLYFYPSLEQILRYSVASSRTTHAAPEALDCCRLMGYAIWRALSGCDKADLLEGSIDNISEPAVQAIARGDFRQKERSGIVGSGYAVRSLEAALWCVHTTATFRDAVLMAANLGDDADTTAAIAGQLAGALYGAEGIPPEWRETLHMGSEIASMAARLSAASKGATPTAP